MAWGGAGLGVWALVGFGFRPVVNSEPQIRRWYRVGLAGPGGGVSVKMVAFGSVIQGADLRLLLLGRHLRGLLLQSLQLPRCIHVGLW